MVDINLCQNYWIYVSDKQEWDRIELYNKGSKKIYLTSGNLCEMQKNDIVMTYIVGAGKNTCFKTIGQTKDIMKTTNNKYTIFNDINRNKYSIEMITLIPLGVENKFSIIADKIKNMPAFTSVGTFRKHFLTTKYIFKKLDDDIGELIVDTLLSSIDNLNESDNESGDEPGNEPNNESSDESNNEPGNESSNESSYKLKNESSNESSDELDNELSIELKNESTDESENESDKISDISDNDIQYIIGSNSSNDSDSVDSSSTSSSDNSEEEIESVQSSTYTDEYDFKIPILLDPCKKFKIKDDSHMISEILDHYKNCDKCEITNNNNTDIFGLLENSRISVEIVDSDEPEFTNMLNAYHFGKKYKLIPIYNKNEIRILLIEDKSDEYNGCVLIGSTKNIE